MKRWIAIAPLVALGLLAALFAGYGLHHDPHVYPDALVGKRFPTLALPPLEGGPKASVNAKLQGATFVNVFASWCVPCAAEAPALEAMQAQGARIVGVSWEDDPAATKRFLAKYGNPFTSVFVDRDGRAAIELGVTGAPETFLVGPDGKVIAKHSAPIQPDDANALMEKAAKAADGAKG
jgi:cytochrome c biogenesis protein CcmG/thiol:disulfide interchange protein DsbE